MIDPSAWVTLARLLRPQGRKGELLADLFTDFPDRFADRQLFLQTAAAEPRPVQVTSHWLPVGRNAGRVVLKLDGIDSINDAESLAGADIVIPAAARLPLEDGAAYISDLIGCQVFNAGHPIGAVIDVEFPTTPDGAGRLEEAAPILTIQTPEPNPREVLIPFVKAFLQHLDVPNRRIEMTLPEGLLDLN